MISPSGTSTLSKVSTPLSRKLVLGLIILLFSLWIIWFVVIPELLLADYIAKSFGSGGVKVVIVGLKKGALCSVHAERVIIDLQPHRATQSSAEENPPAGLSSPGPLDQGDGLQGLAVRDVNIAPDMLSLLKLSPRLNFTGQVGRVNIQGVLFHERQGSILNVSAAGLQISDLTGLKSAGIHGEGNLSFRLVWSNNNGTLQFSISSAKLKGSLPGINTLPLELFHTVRGVIRIGDRITVHPLTLEGTGVYLRINGDIRAGNFDGRAELMLEPSSAHYPLLQTIMASYRQSPGYYVIPGPGVHAANLSGWNRNK